MVCYWVRSLLTHSFESVTLIVIYRVQCIFILSNRSHCLLICSFSVNLFFRVGLIGCNLLSSATFFQSYHIGSYSAQSVLFHSVEPVTLALNLRFQGEFILLEKFQCIYLVMFIESAFSLSIKF